MQSPVCVCVGVCTNVFCRVIVCSRSFITFWEKIQPLEYNVLIQKKKKKKPFRKAVGFGWAAPSVYVLSPFCLTFLSPPLLGPDAPVAELHDLFCKKLQQCCVLFDFLDCVADLKGKEIKRAALNELVESVATSRGVLIEPLYPEAIKMVRAEEGARG